MGEVNFDRGLLDTSAVIDLEKLAMARLPDTLAISAITLAELSAGPAAAKNPLESAIRQTRLQLIEAAFEALPFDAAAARAFGLISAGVLAAGRQPRRRAADLMIAATALSEGMVLVTRNPKDFVGLEGLVKILAV